MAMRRAATTLGTRVGCFAAALLVTAGAASIGCTKRAPPPPSADAGAPVVRVSIARCPAVIAAPNGIACEVNEKEREVRLRVTPEDARVRITWAEGELASRATSAEGGRLLTVEVPAGGDAGALRVLVEGEKDVDARTFEVRRAAHDARLDRARALHREGRSADAIAILPDASTLPEALRGRASSMRARLDLAAGRAPEAIAGFRAAMREHRRDGRLSDEGLDAMALVHTLLSQGRYGEARAVLDEIAGPLVAWADGAPRASYYRALIAHGSGDLRGALRALGAAEHEARTLGSVDLLHSERLVTAEILQSLGRTGEARAILRDRERETTGPSDGCKRAEILEHRSWIELIAREDAEAQDPKDTGSLRAILDASLTAYEQGCPRPAKVQNAHVNLALGAAQEGDADRAEKHLRAARAIGPPPAWIAGWLLDVEGRVGMLRGRPLDALASYDELSTRARAAYAPETLWRALVGRGRALEKLARRGDAIAALREAEALLDRWGPAIPLDAGRASFFGGHAESSVRYAELLVAASKTEDATRVVRTARARAIASADRIDRVASLRADQRARWDDAVGRYHAARASLDAAAAGEWALAAAKLPRAMEARRADEAKAREALDDAFAALGEGPAEGAPRALALAPGELLLLYQTFAREQPARVFAVDEGGVVTSPITLPPSGASLSALAELLLGPVAPSISRARRIRVLATGDLLRVDFHALPFAGAPLVAHAPIAYAMDLPSAPPDRASARAPSRPMALVVADPRNDLADARREATQIEASLGKAFAVEVLTGDAAQKAAVLRSLAGAWLFHFSGHGAFAGPTGWDSALALADTGTLGPGDILTLRSVPRYVILSACDAARSPSGSHLVDVNLAHAFASAGSDAVVAAVRPVGDAPAAAISAALYANVANVQGGEWDLAAALRDAQRAVLRATPDADWAAHRLITR